MQLLRVLETNTYRRVGDVRLGAPMFIICATCRDLPALVASRAFRQDLSRGAVHPRASGDVALAGLLGAGASRAHARGRAGDRAAPLAGQRARLKSGAHGSDEARV